MAFPLNSSNLNRFPNLFICLALLLITSTVLVGCSSKSLRWEDSQVLFADTLQSRYPVGSTRRAILDRVGVPTSTFSRNPQPGANLSWPPTVPEPFLKEINRTELEFGISAFRVDTYEVFASDVVNNPDLLSPYTDLLFYDEADQLLATHRMQRR
ncbi:MAG: hypothetical protein SFY68_06970 [Candidatus Sumerlaeia bacterium]|nr:hypothetical protein [Candidatus Sumerlaeia bacterium]